MYLQFFFVTAILMMILVGMFQVESVVLDSYLRHAKGINVFLNDLSCDPTTMSFFVLTMFD